MTQVLSSLHGLGVAMVTPFNEQGNVDFPALQRMVEHQIKGGTAFLVVLGTTGETPTLSAAEQRRVVDFVLEVNAGRLPVVVGVTGNNTAELCERIHNWDVSGVAAFLVATPAYNKPGQEGLKAHYTSVADAAQRPVILYNVPGRTSCNMSAATTLTLANHSNVIGIKEASGDLEQIGDILAGRPPHFAVWSGDDALAMPTVAMGAEGLISVLGNAFPKPLTAMVEQASFGQTHEARSTHAALKPLMKLMFEEGNPAGIKAAMNHLGLCEGDVRLPLTKASSALKDKLYAAIAALEVSAH
ncbi:MAG: 4-hydroxy-tetrahydrodipicolinate synthase [Bacteroidota bacterium]|nr:4-hydroxy-tetrahydrodipicolinate synthase [Bacteroidota bacterium]MEC7949963.1 4-hydroxy-tetrahydrodipicolinate synthase [Bacteroidota bacterium]MED5318815.1 4-hydroxy-tetrahydrodipicolinate synthase [Bacteroidota bacterium]